MARSAQNCGPRLRRSLCGTERCGVHRGHSQHQRHWRVRTAAALYAAQHERPAFPLSVVSSFPSPYFRCKLQYLILRGSSSPSSLVVLANAYAGAVIIALRSAAAQCWTFPGYLNAAQLMHDSLYSCLRMKIKSNPRKTLSAHQRSSSLHAVAHASPARACSAPPALAWPRLPTRHVQDAGRTSSTTRWPTTAPATRWLHSGSSPAIRCWPIWRIFEQPFIPQDSSCNEHVEYIISPQPWPPHQCFTSSRD